MASVLDNFGIVGAVFTGLLGLIGIWVTFNRPEIPVAIFQSAVEPYIQYLPNTLFVYGFISDIINYQYRYSIQSFTALVLLVLVKFLGSFTAEGITAGFGSFANSVGLSGSIPSLFTALGVGSAIAYTAPTASAVITTAIIATAVASIGIQSSDKCAMPGLLGAFDNNLAPANILTSMTILWYALMEDWMKGMGDKTTFLGIMTMLTFISQWISFNLSNCSQKYKYGSAAPFIALVLSILTAIASYFANSAIPYPYKNVSAPVPSATPGVFVCPAGMTPNAKGECAYSSTPPKEIPIVVGEPSKQTEPVDDQDQFVCEAYKDGELVTSTIVE